VLAGCTWPSQVASSVNRACPSFAGGVGVEHRVNGKRVAQIVDARPARRRAGREPGQAHEPMERVMNVAVKQPVSGQRDKERRRASSWRQPVTQSLIAAQRIDGAGMQRQLPSLAELPEPHRESSGGEVDITAIERDRLADSENMPVTASRPIKVANVVRRSGVDSVLVVAISAAISASE
jgi:hypothetical protein